MSKQATLYRMVMDKHICPYGLKAKSLLETNGYQVTDKHLTTREETDNFKKEYDVKTTPQIFINNERIGGYDDLRKYLGLIKNEDGKTYQPVIAIFSVAFLISLAISWVALGTIFTGHAIGWFIAVSMCFLGVQKLQNLETFTTTFLNYDVLAQKEVRYAYFYPFAETLAGVLMLAGILTWFAAPLALFISSIGAYSVYKAVYIDKRELKCACVGGDSQVPLGFISLTENLMMMGMAVWMLSNIL